MDLMTCKITEHLQQKQNLSSTVSLGFHLRNCALNVVCGGVRVQEWGRWLFQVLKYRMILNCPFCFSEMYWKTPTKATLVSWSLSIPMHILHTCLLWIQCGAVGKCKTYISQITMGSL